MNELVKTKKNKQLQSVFFTKILIIGGGISGRACAKWLNNKGKEVIIVDSRNLDDKVIKGTNIVIKTGIKYPLDTSWFNKIDTLIISPGLSPHSSKKSGVAEMLDLARREEIPVLTELDLFEMAVNTKSQSSNVKEKSNNNYKAPVIAVTGTNGKTSVVKLVVKLLNSVGIDAQPAGNIRPSLLEAILLRESIKRMPDVWVLELSSFQLALTKRFSPTFSTILNISSDHSDWHENGEEYLHSKLKVFGVPKPTAKAFICRDEEKLSRVIYKHLRNSNSENINKHKSFITFGIGLPGEKGDFGINQSGRFCYRNFLKKNIYHEFELSIKDINLIGAHNFSNIAFCLAVASQITNKFNRIIEVLKNHVAENHRLENFLSLDQTRFFDDSKATNIGATVAAMNSLKEPIILIIGGDTKGQDFNILSKFLVSRPPYLIVFGKNVSSICEEFFKAGLNFYQVENLNEVVSLIKKIVDQKVLKNDLNEKKINVLFSPACSSLDMFNSFRHRGQEFKKLIFSEFKVKETIVGKI
ncbi:MAG: UDP-N-acetylmuramoyl-L-alanine--D-glutamate ligase [Betaproteobacteria bacterium TMED156]|nr:MAG: UDP-N-acetylmuramoyl-L-alanine--D-glutamate ligase [Betaproteobacteria bacterium TMED156]